MAFTKPLMLGAAAALVATMLLGLSGCGDDDVGNGPNPDAGNDVVNPPPPPPPPPDGGDAGCNFTQFVTDLVNTQTTPTAKPSNDLGDNCTDNQTPFPATFFQ